ncbi:MAG TPA: hypothetical protein VL995_21820 [Cellvibrio sp.]|nr:hypothetical protein [Cellvibrio sp.]
MFRKNLTRYSSGLLLILGSSITCAQQDNYVAAGSAYSLESNQLLYRELFTSLDESKSVRVDYTSPSGETFATKTLAYQGEPFQPGFNYEDSRDGELVSAQFEGARLVLTHGLNNSRNQKIIHDNARIVIDAGLDAYIQLNWEKLLADKRLKFDYAMPAKLNIVQLEVRKIKGSESPVYDKQIGREWIYFRIAPAKKIASLFSDPINLAYDPNGKYLMRFHGRSNIDDDQGGPVDVRIEYEYLN